VKNLRISVVIPTKNRPTDLLKAVASVISQNRVPDQLIMVDQSDSDASRAEIEDMVSGAARPIQLVYVYDTGIKGLVHAKQVGVSKSDGDVVCFLEDDVVLEPDYTKQMELAFENHPAMMGCCGVMTNLPELPSNYVLFFHLFHRGIFHDFRVGVHGHLAGMDDGLIPSRYLSGGTSAFRKDVFGQVPFDLANGFFMLEDIDFSMRAVKAFGDCFYINPAARLAHYMSPVNRAVLGNKYRRKLREFLVFYKKHGTGVTQLAALIWLLVGLWAEAMLTSLRTRNPSPLAGYIRGVLDGLCWTVRNEEAVS